MTCLFTGCSLTEGIGLEFIKDDPGLWCNILHQTHPTLNKLNIINLGVAGASNDDIFKNTVEGMLTNNPKYTFVCWTEPYRTKVNPGLETYETSIFLHLASKFNRDVELNNVTYTKNYIEDIKNRYFDLNHLHYEFLSVLNYCRILRTLAEYTKSKIYFINGICEWDQNYFNYTAVTPDKLTNLTKKLIRVDNRDDAEIYEIYNKMHNEYQNTKGLSSWLNLYQGFMYSFYLDKGNDNMHPGYHSNKEFAKFLLAQF